MTVYYPRESSGLGAFFAVLIVAAVLILAVLWFIGHRERTGAHGDLLPTATATGSSASSDLPQAGSAASSALSKASAAASTAVSETSADIKAAVNKQKQQEAAERRAN